MHAIARHFPVLLVVLIAVWTPRAVHAQTGSSKPYASLFVMPAPAAAHDAARAAVIAARSLEQSGEAVRPRPPGRAPLNALYAGFITLQALDAHSTIRALDRGYREVNPLMRWAGSSTAALVTVKAAATAGTIFIAERIRKKHPKRALIFMAAIDAAYAVIVTHHYRAAADGR
jgi:hypothetical protein